jgi:hypothetical protein
VQSMKAQTEGSAKPIQDQYFLRRLDLASGPGAIAFVAEGGVSENARPS